MAPYFIPIMELLNCYLTPGINENLESLQIMVIRMYFLIMLFFYEVPFLNFTNNFLELLSEFVEALDPKLFEPYLDTSLKCGLSLLQEAKDNQPEVRAVCYGLFSAVAKVSVDHLIPYMDVVMQHVMKSLENSIDSEYTQVCRYKDKKNITNISSIKIKQKNSYNAYENNDEEEDIDEDSDAENIDIDDNSDNDSDNCS